MKYIDNENGCRVVELTRRNLQVLLAKLDDPLSARGLMDADAKILVRAIEADNTAVMLTRRPRLRRKGWLSSPVANYKTY